MDDTEQALAMHAVAISDIAFFKSQQWRVTNYAVLVDAAIVAIPGLSPKIGTAEHFWLWGLSVLVLVVGIGILCRLESSISKGRDRIAALRLLVSETVMKAWAGKDENVESFRDGAEKSSLIWLFIAVVVLGFLIDSWLLWRLA